VSFCGKCGQHFAVHEDDGSCVQDHVFHPLNDDQLIIEIDGVKTSVFADWDDNVAMCPFPNADRDLLSKLIKVWWPTLHILWTEDLETKEL